MSELRKIRGQIVRPLASRLQRRSIENNLTGCIEWQGALRNGYGRISVGLRTEGELPKSRLVHRLAYELSFGPIPDGLYVCHKCDNRRCINPNHLFTGTHQDNVDDREMKGRNNPPKGEKHGRRKLTNEQVLDIRASSLSSRALGKEYGVDHKTILDIKSGIIWKHLIPHPPTAE